MKKMLFILLTVALIAASLPAWAAAELPQSGDSLHGFTVQSVIPMEVLGATGVLFEHDKSGAQLLYLSTDDTNRSFDITFKTPALDDKGKPHVFEHITISGSKKYPDANLFFPFTNQTYNTFVNALTYAGMTSFPLSSLSEDQLLPMMDYYLAGVFTPLLYDEPRLAQREAWRYELSSADAPLNIAGTVYSEMQGAMNISAQAAQNNLKALFEGSPAAHNSGGDPESVRTLTSEELIAFHDAYYHPSNALIILYGDLDIDRFLAHIDTEYLSKYDKKDVYVERGAVEPYKQTLYKTFDAPVENGATTEKSSYIYYSFAADGATAADTASLMMLAVYLNSEASPLMRGIREDMPGVSVSASVDMDMPVPAVIFTASGVDESDRDKFVGIVDAAIGQIGENGIDAEDFDSVVSLQKLGLLLTQENSTLGVSASLSIALAWSRFGIVDYYNVFESVVNGIDAESAAALSGKYLKDNAHRAVSVTRPVAGLAEENAAKLQSELDEIKAAMSAEEIDALVKQSQEFMAWSSAAPDANIVEKFTELPVDSLPEEIKHYDVTDAEKNGVRYVTAAANINDIAQLSILLDASTIPADKLRDCAVYLNLLGSLDTQAHTKEELATLTARYLSGFSSGLSASSAFDKTEGLYAARLSWIGLTQDAEKSVLLAKELLLDTKLDGTDDITDALTRMNNSTRDSFDAAALSLQMSRLSAALSDEGAFNNYVSGIDMYRHIQEMLKDPDGIAARLEEARSILANRHGAIVELAGDVDTLSAYQGQIEAFLNELPDTAREKTDPSALRPVITSEALINNSSVHMNMIADTQSDFSGKYLPISGLINDMYMLPKLRNALGAYGAYISFGNKLSYMYTYRDPNVSGSFELYAQLGDYLRNCELSQADVDRYIIGSYSALSSPEGELSGAISAASRYLAGLSDETRLLWQRQAKALTVEEVRAAADRIDELVKNGLRSTSGTVTSIGEDMDLFDSVVRLEDAETSSDAAA